MFGVFCAPLVGRVVDRVVPWTATVLATLALIVFQAIQTGAGGISIACVIIVCFGIDVFRQTQQVSLTTAVFGIEPKARSRLNSVILISVRVASLVQIRGESLTCAQQVFLGQIMGTSVGTQVVVRFGWRPAAALSVAWSGFTLAVMLARGPHCSRYTWFGYEGGWRMRKELPSSQARAVPEQDAEAQHSSSVDEKSIVGKEEAGSGCSTPPIPS